MLYDLFDSRTPLAEGSTVISADGTRYIIDRLIGSGGFSLTYMAHAAGSSGYVVLKEMFPVNVGDAAVERGADGRIAVKSRADSEDGDRDAWREFSQYLYREAELTGKAASVYGEDGGKDTQNDPDVFRFSEPFRDVCGNLYAVVETARGEPLLGLIESGLVRGKDRRALENGNLGEILQVLADTARLLAKLHGDCNMLHLDLSPLNIYLTKASAGTRLEPHIIDYGSAYDRDDPREAFSHRYTCNLFSSPEVTALSALNDSGAGYRADASSDTYSIAAILFYAVTGSVYSPETLFDRNWREQIRLEYSPEWYGDTSEDSFYRRLIAFFEKGLSSRQEDRFRTASELHAALTGLREAFRRSGNLLGLVESDELTSLVVLDRYPLYRYRSASGDLDVLCLGSGTFVKRMILSMLGCGQMTGSRLAIHVVSSEPEEEFRSELLRRAPMLSRFSDLVPGSEGEKYVSFTYERVPDLLLSSACADTARRYSYCRYVLISLGGNGRNIDLARMYAKEISRASEVSCGPTVINYYIAEDAAANVRSRVSEEGISPLVSLVPFGSQATGYAERVRLLARRALRLDHFYERLGDPSASFADTAKRFRKDAYSQRSSCASALHLRYKLASFGIDADDEPREVISAYRRLLGGPERGALIGLEHRRWMMYMTSEGYTYPDMARIDEYSFADSSRGFNASFRDDSRKLHNCLVPCSDGGLRLSELSRSEWDSFGSYEDIDASEYDELDRMSLKVHLLARRKAARESTRRRLLDDFRNLIGERLEARERCLRNGGADAVPYPDGTADRMAALRRLYEDTAEMLEGVSEEGPRPGTEAALTALEWEFSALGIDAATGFRAVRNDLAIYVECTRYRDYKAADATIVDNLLRLIYADDAVSLIKLRGRTAEDDAACPSLLDPRTLVFLGSGEDGELLELLRSQGCGGDVEFVSADLSETGTVYLRLLRTRKRVPGPCVIDVTGCGSGCVDAALRLSREDPSVSVVRSGPGHDSVEGLSRFDLADAYSREISPAPNAKARKR